MNLEEKIKENIEKQHLIPKSKIAFLFREWTVWFLGLFSVIIGSLAVSASIFVVFNSHWRFYKVTHDSFLNFFLEFIPLLWIVSFLIFIFFTYKFLRITKRGYKYNFIFIILGVFIVTIVLGIISFGVGFGETIEKRIGSHILFYRDVSSKERISWNRPKEGLFLGNIFVKDGKYFIKNINDESFEMDTNGLNVDVLRLIDSDDELRIIGTTTKDGKMIPCAMSLFEVEGIEKMFSEKKLTWESVINFDDKRMNICKGVRPYSRLKN